MAQSTTTVDKERQRELEVSEKILTRVLLVCPSQELALYIQKGLSVGNLESFVATTLNEARGMLSSDRGISGHCGFGSILVELADPPDPDSLEQVGRICAQAAPTPVVGVAPDPSATLVRDAMRHGVCDFLTNPFNRAEIADIVRSAIGRAAGLGNEAPQARAQESEERLPSVEAIAPEPENAHSAQEAVGYETVGAGHQAAKRAAKNSEVGPDLFITGNVKMKRILDVLDRVAPTDSTVLIGGESGTGKELIARRIHNLSQRSSGPFVEVHCGAIPPSLLESQLFGHEKGSFTGAFSRQAGVFEIADRGTIFLDEIAEMELEMQVKLLRVLQERTFRRIGGRQSIHVDVRVLAATNRELQAEVEEKRFRVDLYYRLNVISLEIPPLRDRLEDIPELVEFFAKRCHREKGLPMKRFSEEALTKLQKMSWIGNVREIENAVERLVLLSASGDVRPEDIDEHLDGSDLPQECAFEPTLTLDEVKKLHIANVLQVNGGNKMKSARVLGINVKTLYNLIQRLELPT